MAIPMELDGRKVEKAQMDDMLLRLGLTERRTHLPNELSGGQQQRTSIGRALITRPSIVFADEPTGSVKLVQHYPWAVLSSYNTTQKQHP